MNYEELYHFTRSLADEIDQTYSKTCIVHVLAFEYVNTRMFLLGETAETARAHVLDSLARWKKTAEMINCSKRADRLVQRIKDGTFHQHYKPRRKTRRKTA